MFLQDQNRHQRLYLSMHLKKVRTELSLSIEEMAVRLDLPLQQYKKLEAGRLRLTEELLERTKSALSLSNDELLEIARIASVAYVNAIAKVLSPNYPHD